MAFFFEIFCRKNFLKWHFIRINGLIIFIICRNILTNTHTTKILSNFIQILSNFIQILSNFIGIIFNFILTKSHLIKVLRLTTHAKAKKKDHNLVLLFLIIIAIAIFFSTKVSNAQMVPNTSYHLV